jgi:hypothetical protein
MGRPAGRGRRTTTEFLALDARWLDRHRKLEAGAICEILQQVNGRPRALIRTNAGDDQLELVVGRSRQFVPIVRTPQPFGGERKWFLCDCGERAAILYGLPFRCRRCRGLAYNSQREIPEHRTLRRAQKIRSKLGGSPSMLDPFPEKPKGTHLRSYHRLWALYIPLERASFELLAKTARNSNAARED